MFRRLLYLTAVVAIAALAAADKKKDQEPASSGTVIETETRLVLVDAVVTDKKGNYVQGLKLGDFRVWEDDKEQTLKSFSSEADAAATMQSQKRFMVLFFDNTHMDFGQQKMARQAAVSFIDENVGPDRLMAVMNYGGSLQLAQNFTADVPLLKLAVAGVRVASLGDNSIPEMNSGVRSVSANSGMPQLSSTLSGFGARSMVLALKNVARSLSPVRGRKMLILFTGGFPLAPEMLSEVNAAIDALNRANVAVYPVDARGLMAPNSHLQPWIYAPADTGGTLIPAGFHSTSLRLLFQRGSEGGGGRGGGGTAPGGSTGGGTTGGGLGGSTGGGLGGGGSTGGGHGSWTPPNGVSGNSPGGLGGGRSGRMPGGPSSMPGMGTPRGGSNFPGNMGRQQPMMIPQIPQLSSRNEEVMYMLAAGTGGFVIRNTNDLAAGLKKIGSELNHYYIVGYTPPESDEGSCHTLKVKVARGGITVRSRTGYCNTKPKDALAGKSLEKDLEARAMAATVNPAQAAMRLPHFYTSANVARVNVAVELPPDSIRFTKEKGKYVGKVNIIGVAYRKDGSVAARFSDSSKLELDNKAHLKEFATRPSRYENQFEVAAGSYQFRLLYGTGGDTYGRLEMPLEVEPYTPQHFALSAMAFSTQVVPMERLGATLDNALLEDRTPLVYDGKQIIPAASSRFKKAQPAVAYFEIYEPFLTGVRDPQKPGAVAIQLRVLDRKTGKQQADSGMMRIMLPDKGDTPMIPMAAKVPLSELQPGSYFFELIAADSAGRQVRRRTNFEVE